MSSNVFAAVAQNMKNNNTKYGCLQLVTRDVNPEFLYSFGQRHEANERARLGPKNITFFGYDPLNLGIPCMNSIRYNPPVFNDHMVSDYNSDASELFTVSSFDDSAWDATDALDALNLDNEIDDAIEREKKYESCEAYDIETGLIDVATIHTERFCLSSSVSSSGSLNTPDTANTFDTPTLDLKDSKIEMYPQVSSHANFSGCPMGNLGVVC